MPLEGSTSMTFQVVTFVQFASRSLEVVG